MTNHLISPRAGWLTPNGVFVPNGYRLHIESARFHGILPDSVRRNHWPTEYGWMYTRGYQHGNGYGLQWSFNGTLPLNTEQRAWVLAEVVAGNTLQWRQGDDWLGNPYEMPDRMWELYTDQMSIPQPTENW